MLNISYFSDEDDDGDAETVYITESTNYQETASASEPESNVPVEKQPTYLVFKPALYYFLLDLCMEALLLLSKILTGSFLCIKQLCNHCNNK